jgi:DNA-binding HxlR family transcriptional regulator
VKSKEEFKIQSFERHSQILRIILILESEKRLNFQSFIDNKGISSTTLYRTIASLKEMKLINSTIDNTRYPPQNVISLTERGRKVAEYLKKIEKILEVE